MFKYMCQLYLRYDAVILPIVVFSDDSLWKIPVSNKFRLEIADKTIVRFEFESVKLKSLNYRNFLDSKNPLAFALMAKMNYNRQEQVRLKADFLRLILGSQVDEMRQSLLVEFVETYVPLMNEDLAQFEELIQSEDQYVEVEYMVTVYEQRGIEKGIENGKQNTLLKQLEKKFGEVPVEMEHKIRSTESIERLDVLLLAVLDAESLTGFLDVPHS